MGCGSKKRLDLAQRCACQSVGVGEKEMKARTQRRTETIKADVERCLW